MVGYLLARDGGLEGLNGPLYNFIFAGNGVFIEAENEILRARVRISPCAIRGLTALAEEVTLKKGLVPGWMLNVMLGAFLSDLEREQFIAVTWEGCYRLVKPPQIGEAGGVTYVPVEGAVLEVHSHGRLAPFFSATDDRDEQGLKVYMVVGQMHNGLPSLALRVGVYGYYAPLNWAEVFDTLPGGIQVQGDFQ